MVDLTHLDSCDIQHISIWLIRFTKVKYVGGLMNYS